MFCEAFNTLCLKWIGLKEIHIPYITEFLPLPCDQLLFMWNKLEISCTQVNTKQNLYWDLASWPSLPIFYNGSINNSSGLYDKERISKWRRVLVPPHLRAPSCLYLPSPLVPLCLSVAYNILSWYNGSAVDQKGSWQESKSTQIPVVYSSYLTSCGLTTTPPAQRGLHSAKHGAIGPAMEALCTLTPKEIGSLVVKKLSASCLRGTAVRLLTVGWCVRCRVLRHQDAMNQDSIQKHTFLYQQ